MKPTEAELYHSLGDGVNEWKVLVLYKIMDTWHRCSPIQANKGQSKEIIMRSLLSWRCNTGLASNYRPSYQEEGGGRGCPEYFTGRRGCISYSLSLGFRILRTHICQLSRQEKDQRKETTKFEPSEVKRDQQISAVCSLLFSSSTVVPTLHIILSLENMGVSRLMHFQNPSIFYCLSKNKWNLLLYTEGPSHQCQRREKAIMQSQLQ